MAGLVLKASAKLLECYYVVILASHLTCLIFVFYCKFFTFRIILFYIAIFKVFYPRITKPNLHYILTLLAFLVLGMGITTLLTQLVSILRAKSWKAVMKCKIYFLSLGLLFLKCTFLKLRQFLLPKCLSKLHNFSVVARIYNVPVFDEAFFLLATVPMITRKVRFFQFSWQILLRKILPSSQSYCLSIQTTIFLKNWSQTDKDYIKNCCKGVSSTPLLRIQTLTMGQNAATISLFLFLLQPVIYVSGLEKFYLS